MTENVVIYPYVFDVAYIRAFFADGGEDLECRSFFCTEAEYFENMDAVSHLKTDDRFLVINYENGHSIAFRASDVKQVSAAEQKTTIHYAD